MKLTSVGTIADVYLNEELVGTVDNIYREYYFRLRSGMLRDAGNILRVDIKSTIQETFVR